MTKQEIDKEIESIGRDLPERLSGNEENAVIAERIAYFVEAERPALLELLGDWIAVRIPQSQRRPGDGVREGAMWLALEIAKRYSLKELCPDIRALIADVRAGRTYLPYYADTIAKYMDSVGC